MSDWNEFNEEIEEVETDNEELEDSEETETEEMFQKKEKPKKEKKPKVEYEYRELTEQEKKTRKKITISLGIIAALIFLIGVYFEIQPKLPREYQLPWFRQPIPEPVVEIPVYGPYEIVKVVDADTLIVNIDGDHVKVRLIGINAPESVHPDYKKNTDEGAIASQWVKNLLSDEKVYLEYDEKRLDIYDRTLAYVYLSDKETMLNAYILQEGYAQVCVFEPNVRYSEYFALIEEKAREEEKGLWANEEVFNNAVSLSISENKVNMSSISENIAINKVEEEVVEPEPEPEPPHNEFDDPIKDNELTYQSDVTIEEGEEGTEDYLVITSSFWVDANGKMFSAMPKPSYIINSEPSQYIGGFSGYIVVDFDKSTAILEQIEADDVKPKNLYDDPDAVLQKPTHNIIDTYYMDLPIYVVINCREGENSNGETVRIGMFVSAAQYCEKNGLDLTQFYYDVLRTEFWDNELYLVPTEEEVEEED